MPQRRRTCPLRTAGDSGTLSQPPRVLLLRTSSEQRLAEAGTATPGLRVHRPCPTPCCCPAPSYRPRERAGATHSCRRCRTIDRSTHALAPCAPQPPAGPNASAISLDAAHASRRARCMPLSCARSGALSMRATRIATRRECTHRTSRGVPTRSTCSTRTSFLTTRFSSSPSCQGRACSRRGRDPRESSVRASRLSSSFRRSRLRSQTYWSAASYAALPYMRWRSARCTQVVGARRVRLVRQVV
jgi:hypothetical protein